MEIQLNTSDADRVFKIIKQGVTDATPLMNAITNSLRRGVEDCFDEEVTPDGSPWAELSPRTLESKRRKGLSLKKNIASGRMSREISYKVYSDRVEIRAEAPYSEYANKRRQFLPEKELGVRGEAQLEAIADRYLDKLAD